MVGDGLLPRAVQFILYCSPALTACFMPVIFTISGPSKINVYFVNYDYEYFIKIKPYYLKINIIIFTCKIKFD